MTHHQATMGALWILDNQLAAYELWKETVRCLLLKHGKCYHPSLIAMFCNLIINQPNEKIDCLPDSLEIRQPLTQLRDALAFALHRDFALANAVEELRSYPVAQRAHGLAYLMERVGSAIDLPAREIDWSEYRRIPARPLPGASMEESALKELLNWCAQTAQILEARPGSLQGSDMALLENRLCHLPLSERALAQEVVLARDWFERNRRLAPRPPQVGDTLTDWTQGPDDAYPTGGIDALASKGSWENLLPSELAFFDSERPSLFELRWLNQELLFFGRDESVQTRPSWEWRVVVAPQVADWLEKPEESPFRRGPFALGWCLAAVAKFQKLCGSWDTRVVWQSEAQSGRQPGGKSVAGASREESPGLWQALAHQAGWEWEETGSFPNNAPRGNEQPGRHHKLIRVEIGPVGRLGRADFRLRIHGGKPVEPCRDTDMELEPRTPMDWLDLDQRVARELPRILQQGWRAI